MSRELTTEQIIDNLRIEGLPRDIVRAIERLRALERENAQLRERVAELERGSGFLIDCMEGKLTTVDQVFGYICKLEVENAHLRSRQRKTQAQGGEAEE